MIENQTINDVASRTPDGSVRVQPPSIENSGLFRDIAGFPTEEERLAAGIFLSGEGRYR